VTVFAAAYVQRGKTAGLADGIHIDASHLRKDVLDPARIELPDLLRVDHGDVLCQTAGRAWHARTDDRDFLERTGRVALCLHRWGEGGKLQRSDRKDGQVHARPGFRPRLVQNHACLPVVIEATGPCPVVLSSGLVPQAELYVKSLAAR
jgi:hypothetical protein